MSDCWGHRSQVKAFKADYEYHQDCMHHSQKISGGRSPSPITREEWESLTRKIELITQDCSILSWTWLSATEGDKDGELARLDHWPETELVNKILALADPFWKFIFSLNRA